MPVVTPTQPAPRSSRTRRAGGAARLRAPLVWVLLLLVGAGAASMLPRALHGEVHDAPVLLVGPDVVTGPLSQDRLASSGLDIGAVESRQEAEASLDRGRVMGIVVLDLSRTRDQLLVADSLPPTVRTALVETVRRLEARFGRSVTVEVTPVEQPSSRTVVVAAFGGVAAALLLVVVVTILFGPFARSLPRGVLRVVGLLVVGLAYAAAAVAIGDLRPGGSGSAVPVVGILALLVVSTGLVALAIEALIGVRGLAVAIALLLVAPLPLLVAGDPVMFQPPWATPASWTGVGAAVDAIQATTVDQATLVRPLAVLIGSGLLALGVLVVARWASRAQPAEQVARRWKLDLALSVGLIAVAALIALMALPAPDPTPPAEPSLAGTTTCVSIGPMDNVADLNRITRLRGSPAFQGGDIGTEVELQDARRMWMFGDTLRANADGDQRLVRNSMLVSGSGCIQSVLPEGEGAIIPDRADGVGYWPMSITAARRPDYDLVTVFAQRVRSTGGTGVFDFEILGPAVAEFIVPVGRTPQLIAQHDLGPDHADTTRPMWGAASVVDGGWLYVYGTARPAHAEMVQGFSLRVARVRPDHVDRRDAWQFWDGTSWSRRESDAAELIGSHGGVSQTLSVFRRGGSWYAFSKKDEVLGTDLVFWRAGEPTGPFVELPAVGKLPSDGAREQLRYMPLAHPDLLPEDGSVLVSYSRNSTSFGDVLRDPMLYRPRFLRVRLPAS